MKKPIKPVANKMVPIQITIMEDGVPIGGWIGMVFDPNKVEAVTGGPRTVTSVPLNVTPTPDIVEKLARRTRIYTEPRPHMKRLWQDLERHDALLCWLNPRVQDCPNLAIYQKSVATVWWDWFDDKLKPQDLRAHHDRIETQCRLAYGQWLMDRFQAYGSRGRDARYSLRTALSDHKRGSLKLRTLDSKLDLAKERLDLLRGKSS